MDRPDTSDADRTFAGPITFLKGVVGLDGLPVDDVPEVAFAGRSNAGKSSLINALAGRKALARTSNTPGRTQELNFFIVGDLANPLFRIVDMPGYGFANAPKDKIKRWTSLILAYLRGRVNLRRVFVLIDGRHGVKKTDLPILDTLDQAAVSYQVVVTKMDKVTPSERAAHISRIEETIQKRPAAYPVIVVTSSVTGEGLSALRGSVLAAVK